MRHIIIVLLLGMMSCLTACFQDDSSMGIREVDDIEITGLKDTSILSFVGNVLTISPEVKTGYPESSLHYAWYMYSSEDGDLDAGYRENQIADTKELNYEVKLSSGDYTFVFEVTTTENNYSRLASMNLRATTAFSEGFYILKETADGKTDLDILAGDLFNEDLIAGMNGVALDGKPTNLSVTYANCYIDEEEQEMTHTNMVHLFTESGEYRSYRTEDMAEIFDNETVRFDGLEEGEIPYIASNGLMQIFFLTSKGVYSVTPGGDFGESSGRYGMPAGTAGGSKYLLPIYSGMMGYYYWNSATHGLYMTDYNGTYSDPVAYNSGDVPESELECIGCGVNYVGVTETSYFLCEHTGNGDRYLYLIDMMGSVNEIRKLDDNLHIAQGEMVALCGMQGTFLYTIHENTVYAYNWNTGEEFSVALPGVGSGEILSYISNQFLNISFGSQSSNFDALIVAAQTGNSYKLYIYKDLVGGVPRPGVNPQVIEGNGKVKCVRFVSAQDLSMEFMMSFGGVILPYWD